jgi:hypothetical protein
LNGTETCKSSKNTSSEVRTLTITGPSQGYCGIRGLLVGESVNLSFESDPPAEGASPLTLAGCDNGTVELSARTD